MQLNSLSMYCRAQKKHSAHEKALILYRQDSVYRVKPMSGHTVSAYVQDVVPVKVFIDLADVKKQLFLPCSNMCRHVLAVYLYLYAQYDRLGTFTEFWKEAQNAAKPGDSRTASARNEAPQPHARSMDLLFNTEFRRWEEHTPKTSKRCNTFTTGIFSFKKRTPAEPELKNVSNPRGSCDMACYAFTRRERAHRS
ncbi:hypothetical protein PO124_21845 [Bacillus licheniformis]|nr:hypothetical protein [Bacillus licheniformis]